MNFIELAKSQYQLLAEYYVDTYNAPPWNDKWTEALALERIEEMMDCRGAFGLVCYDDDGSFAGAILGNPELFYDCKQFFVKDFFVRPALQGKGIGSLLLAELETRLIEKGISKLYLFTSRGEQTEGFYQRRGFNTWSGMVLMGKNL